MKTRTSKLIAAAALSLVAIAVVGSVGFAKAAASSFASEIRTGTTEPGVEFKHGEETVIVLTAIKVTPTE